MHIKQIKELAKQKKEGFMASETRFQALLAPGVQLVINGHTLFFEKESEGLENGEQAGGVYVHIDGVLRGYFDLNNDPFFRVYEGPEGDDYAGAVEWTKDDRAIFVTD